MCDDSFSIVNVGKSAALRCHVCTREKNETCGKMLENEDFAEDCGAYSNFCAMLSVDDIVEVRGCISTFVCRNDHQIKCCLCEEDLCNHQRLCHPINKSTTSTSHYITLIILTVHLFLASFRYNHHFFQF